MKRQWRKRQWVYNIEAGMALRTSRGDGFAGWVVITLFYAAMTVVNARFERTGLGVPKSHARRRRMVKKYMSQVFEDYRDLCMMSEDARYGKGYMMNDAHCQEAQRLHDAISKAIPWPHDP